MNSHLESTWGEDVDRPQKGDSTSMEDRFVLQSAYQGPEAAHCSHATNLALGASSAPFGRESFLGDVLMEEDLEIA